MRTFILYLLESKVLEANSAGSKFEQQIADNIQQWIEANNLSDKFLAERYQKVSEVDSFEAGKIDRDESYSDVVVHDLEADEDIFVECKSSPNANIAGTFFRIDKQLNVIPTVGRMVSKEDLDDRFAMQLASDIMNTESYQKFKKFMLTKQLGIAVPKDILFSDLQPDERMLNALVRKYNKLVDDGIASGSKLPEVLREKTKKLMAVALIWRLHDTSCTWDICNVQNIDYFSDLIRDHYLNSKIVKTDYIQLGDNLFKFKDNPLNIDCDVFPDTIGSFLLKFTPRIGVGAMYLTPRSNIVGSILSRSSFLSKDRWPICH